MRFPLLWCLVLLAAGCGPSPGDVVDSHRPAYAALKEKLRRLAAKLPAERLVEDQPPEKPFAPLLVLATEKVPGNAEAVMLDSLTSDDADPDFDLHLSPRLTTALFWTGDGQRDHARGDVKFMSNTLQSGLDLKYLVVHRVAELTLPEGVNDREYRPGHVVVEGFVFDLASEELLARYLIEVETDDKVQAEVLPDEKDSEALTRFARSTLYVNCRKAIREKLEGVVGGQAEIE